MGVDGQRAFSSSGDLGSREGIPFTKLASGPSREQAVQDGEPCPTLVSSTSGFLNHHTTDILVQMIDVGSVLCIVHYLAASLASIH